MFKMHWKKTICAAAATLMIAGAGFAASPEDTYKEAVANMAAQPDGQYTLVLALDVPMGQVKATNVIGVKAQPFQLKDAGTINLFNKEELKTTVYAEQNGKAVDIYSGLEKQGKTEWKKTTQALHSSQPVAESLKGNHNVLAGVKSITAAGNNQYVVTMDSSRIYQKGDEAIWAKQGLKKDQVNMLTSVLQALQQSGDTAFTVTIDPSSKRITRVEGNFTKEMKDIVNTVVGQTKAAASTKEFIQGMVNQSQLHMTIDCAALPAGADLTAPQSVKDAVANQEKQKKTA